MSKQGDKVQTRTNVKQIVGRGGLGQFLIIPYLDYKLYILIIYLFLYMHTYLFFLLPPPLLYYGGTPTKKYIQLLLRGTVIIRMRSFAS